ncbi:hypothetical protein [Natrinema salinisoli]|uniref:hypothetical protein n=1 Tax=Natrinema salinisoli TaxID=2878535 RepID=UPI001CF0366C|nr:hypothetical protein [Natrinema salinisoli]
MWPVDFYVIAGGLLLDSVAALAGHGEGLELYRSLEPIVRAGIQFVGTALVAMIVLGLLQQYGTTAVAKSRGSPIISFCIGVPILLIVGGVTSTGIIIVDSSIGAFFGIPMVVIGAAILPVATAVGFVAIGRTVASRFGSDRLSTGLFVGALLSGVSGLAFPATVGVVGVAAALGTGATVRVLFGASGTGNPNERTVPPANKI